MNDDSAFSADYELGTSTDSTTFKKEQRSPFDKRETDDIRKRIESDYSLLKPERIFIRARIIPQ